jgi:hypothetical protein
MLLRTLAGSHAGQVEDYTYEAGRHALAAGFAQQIDTHAPVTSMTTTPEPVPAPPVLRSRGRSGRKAQNAGS